MKSGLLPRLLLSANLILPLGEPQNWKSITYGKIPANTITSVVGSLNINVKKSASPLVYKFENPIRLNSIRFAGVWTGNLNIPSALKQGSKGADDFVLRIGLVVAGDKRLNFIQKKLAPDWVKQLHDLAPSGSGIDRIHFLVLTQDNQLKGTQRKHPLSDLLLEDYISSSDKPERFTAEKNFLEGLEVLGLWISADGDDTKSTFTVEIDQLEITSGN